MSFLAMSWAIKQRGIKPATKLVLMILADCHNRHTGRCDPSQARLADECEMSRSTVNLHLQKLEDRGLIRRIQRFDEQTKRRQRTSYILVFDEAENPMSENRTRKPEAMSGKSQKPCPKNGESHVRISDMNHGRGTRNPTRKEKGSILRKDWSPSPGLRIWAGELGFSANEIDRKTGAFVRWHREKGTVARNPDALWKAWLLKTEKRRETASVAHNDSQIESILRSIERRYGRRKDAL